MLIELHVLQNFAPSNLNRDDTGAPKSCQFGGVTRARVSSQCWKRAARRFVDERGLLTKTELGHRSKLLKGQLMRCLVKDPNDELAKRLMSELDQPFRADAAPIIAEFIARVFSKKMKGDSSAYLVFIGEGELRQTIKVCQQHRPTLESYAQKVAEQQAKREAKASKKKAQATTGTESPTDANADIAVAVGADDPDESDTPEIKLSGELKKAFDEFQKAIIKALDVKSAADVAMFGRMLADLPEKNIDAACQVAHPISTHAVGEVEFDYFTAMDDLQPEGVSGAAQIGTTEFNSACYYRYANINTEQLAKNLNGNGDLAGRAAQAFLQAFVRAVPSGKQNSYSSPTPPTLVLAIVREYGLCSLANAFETPVRASEREGVVKKSVRRLDEHFGRMNKMYGEFNGGSIISVFGEHDDCLKELKKFDVNELDKSETDGLSKLINRTVAAAFGDGVSIAKKEQAP